MWNVVKRLAATEGGNTFLDWFMSTTVGSVYTSLQENGGKSADPEVS